MKSEQQVQQRRRVAAECAGAEYTFAAMTDEGVPLMRTGAETMSLGFPDAELVLGFVCAVGTDYDGVRRALSDYLKHYGYSSHEIKISGLLENLNTGQELRDDSEYRRIRTRMRAGNSACRRATRTDFLALVAASEILKSRVRADQGAPEPRPRTAHLLLTLKRPGEIETLRQIYGRGFYVIGVYATETQRLGFLKTRKGCTEEDARDLIARDRDEEDDFGQKTSEAFQLADIFVEADQSGEQLERFLQLVFGAPYITPDRDEHAMFLAYAASIRSAQFGRQVGAVLVSTQDDVLAVGCNDVPRFGGGLYWPGPDDQRDHIRGRDSNDQHKKEILEDIRRRMKDYLKPGVDVSDDIFEGSPLLDRTEFGRAVHAEMDALLSCARTGVSTAGGTLYTTTFPCHNCTRHLIVAGIRRVVYVEPYEKSKAQVLHNDSLVVKDTAPAQSRNTSGEMLCEHFVGIGPRRYFDLFSMRLSEGRDLKRKKDGKIVEWKPGTSLPPRVELAPTSYLQREEIAGRIVAAVVQETEEGAS